MPVNFDELYKKFGMGKEVEPVIEDEEPVIEDEEPVDEDIKERQKFNRFQEWVSGVGGAEEAAEILRHPEHEKYKKAFADPYGQLIGLRKPGPLKAAKFNSPDDPLLQSFLEGVKAKKEDEEAAAATLAGISAATLAGISAAIPAATTAATTAAATTAAVNDEKESGTTEQLSPEELLEAQKAQKAQKAQEVELLDSLAASVAQAEEFLAEKVTDIPSKSDFLIRIPDGLRRLEERIGEVKKNQALSSSNQKAITKAETVLSRLKSIRDNLTPEVVKAARESSISSFNETTTSVVRLLKSCQDNLQKKNPSRDEISKLFSMVNESLQNLSRQIQDAKNATKTDQTEIEKRVINKAERLLADLASNRDKLQDKLSAISTASGVQKAAPAPVLATATPSTASQADQTKSATAPGGKGIAVSIREDGVVKSDATLFDSDLSTALAKYAALEVTDIDPSKTAAAQHEFSENKYRWSDGKSTVSAFARSTVVCLPAKSGYPSVSDFKKGFKETLDHWKHEIERAGSPLNGKTVNLKFVLQDSDFAGGVGHFTYLNIAISADKEITITNTDPMSSSTVDLKAIEGVVGESFQGYQLQKSKSEFTDKQKDTINCGFYVAIDVVREFSDEKNRTPLEAELIDAKSIPAIRHAFVKMICEQDNVEYKRIAESVDSAITSEKKEEAKKQIIDIAEIQLEDDGGDIIYPPGIKAKQKTETTKIETPKTVFDDLDQDGKTKVLQTAFGDSFKDKLKWESTDANSGVKFEEQLTIKSKSVVGDECRFSLELKREYKKPGEAKKEVERSFTLTRTQERDKKSNDPSGKVTWTTEGKDLDWYTRALVTAKAQFALNQACAEAMTKKKEDPKAIQLDELKLSTTEKANKCNNSEFAIKETEMIDAFLRAGFERVLYKSDENGNPIEWTRKKLDGVMGRGTKEAIGMNTHVPISTIFHSSPLASPTSSPSGQVDPNSAVTPQGPGSGCAKK